MKHDFIDQNAREQLSALLDGELGNDDSARFLERRLQHDDALVGQLVRWQLAGDVLRANARSPHGEEDLAGRVRAAIEREQATAAPAQSRRRGWMLWGSGLATAAALGFAALNMQGTADPTVPAPAKVAATVPAAHQTIAATVVAPITASVTTKAPSPVDDIEAPAVHRAPEAAPRHRQRDEVASVSRHVQREVQETVPAVQPREVVVAASVPNKMKTKPERNPFSMPSGTQPSELAWPKAVLPGFNSGLNANFRTDDSARNPFMPHRTTAEVLPQH